MKIIEKIESGKIEGKFFYIGHTENTFISGRWFIDTDEQLEVGDSISKENPIKTNKMVTLCVLCAEVYEGGEDYSNRMKMQAVDLACGYLSKDEIEFGL